MAIRFSLFGRHTRAPGKDQRQVYASLKDATEESGLLPASDAMKHIRERARERFARADQAFGQTENAG